MLVVGALTYVGALAFGTTQIYQLAFALLALLVLAFGLAFWNAREIAVVRNVPQETRIMAGSASEVELIVRNESWAASSPLEVSDRLPRRETFRVSRVRGRGQVSTTAPVLFDRRGIYELGPAELYLTDPFGLVRYTRRFAELSRVTVYPRVHELSGFPLGDRSIEDAGARGRALRAGDEFFGLREYRRGDDPRHIHWKSFARTGEVQVKEFAASSPRQYTVFLDLLRPERGGSEREVEDAVSAAGTVLRHFGRERTEARLLSSDRKSSATEFNGSEVGYWAAMERLAVVKADGDRRPGVVLREALGAGRERFGDGVVLVVRAVGDELVESVQRLRSRGLSVVVVAVAAHTYRAMRAHDERVRESEFVATVGRLAQFGVSVRVVRYSGGVREGLEAPAGAGARPGARSGGWGVSV